jgi:mannan endo-1,4-beta-mannosidase
LLVVATLVGIQLLADGRGSDAGAERPSSAAGPPPRVALGVTTVSLARNSYRPWKVAELREVDDFERGSGERARIVMWFADWAHSSFDPRQAEAVAQRGAAPEIAWEPWDSSVGTHRRQPRYTLASIVEGRHDSYVRRWATAIAHYGGPVRLRFAHEMNGDWYPWAERANGNQRGQYLRAWRHVHSIFSAAGATNVTWVWCPVASRIDPGQYPGDRFVDVVGLTGLNGGSVLFDRKWRSFRSSYAQPLDSIGRLAPGKPIEISEVASTEAGGDKAAWIREMFAEVRRHPAIRSLIWFNVRKETDWRISSSPAAQRAFAAGVRSLREEPPLLTPAPFQPSREMRLR